MFLNEGEAKLVRAHHEFFHTLLCKAPFASVLVQVGGRLHDDAQEGPLCRIHRRFLELLWRHFTKALEAADLDLAFAAEALAQELLAVGFVAGIGDLAALAQAVEGRPLLALPPPYRLSPG